VGKLFNRGGIGVKRRRTMAKSIDQMTKAVVDQADDYIGETVRKASQFTSSVANAVEDGLDTAKRAASDGRNAIEEFLHNTSKRVKRRPIESVLLSLAAGIAFGLLMGRATHND
jgi:ElaB/YqjD/DUF883 family membrane-anchored ribosome-binding protein